MMIRLWPDRHRVGVSVRRWGPAGRPARVGLLAGLFPLVLMTGCSSPDSGGQDSKKAAGASGAGGTTWSAVARPSTPYNLILISLDTTRPDRFSCYGFSKKTTPHMDRVAGEGVLFEKAFTSVPVTLPAHSIMMTGLYPFENGVRHNGSFVLSDTLTTLAELLKAHGYATGAVLGAYPVSRKFGLAQGFDFFEDRFAAVATGHQGETAERAGTEVTRLASAWIAQNAKQPFFLWAHYFDPHAPYHPAEPFKSRFSDDPYSGEVAAMDEAVGTLLQDLKSKDLLEKTVILIVGDHGEGLGDHSEPTHSMFIYGSTLQVPFLVRLPRDGGYAGKEWRGRKVEDLVTLVDLLPTVWNALGLESGDLPAHSGRSLLPLIEGNGSGHDWIYVESLVPDFDYGLSELRGIQTPSWKYIRAPQVELYNLEKDPGELRNLAANEKDRVAAMEAQLKDVLKTEKGTSNAVAMDAETVEKLRSLGYLGGNLGNQKQRTDPKELTGVGGATSRAQSLADAGQLTAALSLVDSLLRVRPDTRLALRQRGNYLMLLDRGNEAVAAYDKALADCNGCPDAFRLMQEQANAYLVAGQPDEALKRARNLARQRPEEQGMNLLLGEILEKKGDLSGAQQSYEKEAQLYPGESLPLVKLGMLEASRDQGAQAEGMYRKAVALNPRDCDALILLSEVLANSGRSAEAAPLVEQALAANPRHPGAHYRKAWLLRNAGNKEEALQHYRTALQGQPNNGALLYELGSLYGEMGRNDEAAKSYQAAVQKGNAPAGAYANLGVLAAQSGKLPEAVRYWEQALERRPPEQEANIIRANLRRAQDMLKGSGREIGGN